MTPTPQERTELQRLADALELARNTVADFVGFRLSEHDPAYRLASALLSLAAESEELRRTAQLLSVEHVHDGYHHLEWLPAAEREQAWEDIRDNLIEQRDAAEESLRTLESRYSALEKAMRSVDSERATDG